MPRGYRLGRRAEAMAATRDRIVEAAIELAIEYGVSGVTMRQVGLRADVAPGTLRNHVADRDALEAAMIERLTAQVPLPSPAIYDGAATIEERMARLLAAGGVFLDRADRLLRMWRREPMVTGRWADVGAAYGAHWDGLMRQALGPLADDDEALAIVRAVLEPSFFESLRGGTRSTAEVADLVARLVSPWLVEAARTRG